MEGNDEAIYFISYCFNAEPDPRLPALERVIGGTLGDESVAYSFPVLAEVGIVNDSVGGQKIVVFYSAGAVSPLDESSIERSREVGSAAVYNVTLGGRMLTFEMRDGQIVDRETGSVWSIFGEATAGELAEQALEPIVHGTHFWFTWAAFTTDSRIYQPSP